MHTITEAQWVLIRLLVIAFDARCVDPYFTDAYYNAERHLYNYLGLRILNEAMDAVRNDQHRTGLVVPNFTGTYREFNLVCDLYVEIVTRGDRKSQRHPDMKRTKRWLFCSN